MVTGGRYFWGEHNITYKVAQSLRCTPENSVAITLQLKKKKSLLTPDLVYTSYFAD